VVAEVAPGCSGLNYLVSILALGIPLASVALHGWWSRLILITSGVVIAIVGNWARVALIGIHNYLWGGGLYGPLHLFQAMAVDWVGFVGLIAGTWVLTTIESRHASTRPAASPPVAWTALRCHAVPTFPWGLAVTLVLMGVAWEPSHHHGLAEPLQDLSLIPTSIGEWRAVPLESERPVLTLDEADHTLIRTYRDPQGHRLTVYVGYLGLQRQGRELVNFDARYDRLHRSATEQTGYADQVPFTYNQAVWMENDVTTSLLFWYEIDGGAYAGRYAAKWATVRQALEGRGSAGAFILLSGLDSNGRNREPDERITAFARLLLPYIRRTLS
jgi:EpsI family protein